MISSINLNAFIPNINLRQWIPSKQTMNKAIVVFFGFLMASVSGSPSMGNYENGACSLQGRVENNTITKFPSWYDQVFHPEFVSNAVGNRYCKIDTDFPKLSDCEWVSRNIERAAANQIPEQYEEFLADPIIFREKGAFAQVVEDDSTGIFQINFGTNPQKLENHKTVLRYLEKTFLQNPQFFDQSPENIVEEIKKTHKMLAEGLPDPNGDLTPGKFRTKFSFVTEDKKDETRETLYAIMRKNGAKNRDIRTVERIHNKVRKYGEAVFENLTPQEKKAYSFLGYSPPAPKEIKTQMLQFAKKFKRIGEGVKKGTKDPVEAAAEVHQQLGNIHPFVDANGRLARSWMNAVLQLGGHQAIVFPDDEAYTAAISKDQRNQQKFVDFLRKVINWNSKQPELQETNNSV
ncbi:MAG: hypothetical protein K940chlam6_01251 [Chlamydiae bacterium]|nr:hypothetical protein [Chlamydiota bacterium]